MRGAESVAQGHGHLVQVQQEGATNLGRVGLREPGRGARRRVQVGRRDEHVQAQARMPTDARNAEREREVVLQGARGGAEAHVQVPWVGGRAADCLGAG